MSYEDSTIRADHMFQSVRVPSDTEKQKAVRAVLEAATQAQEAATLLAMLGLTDTAQEMYKTYTTQDEDVA